MLPVSDLCALRERKRVEDVRSRQRGDLHFAGEERGRPLEEVLVVFGLRVVGGIGRKVGKGNACRRTQDVADHRRAKVGLKGVDGRFECRATFLPKGGVAERRRREEPLFDGGLLCDLMQSRKQLRRSLGLFAVVSVERLEGFAACALGLPVMLVGGVFVEDALDVVTKGAPACTGDPIVIIALF